MLTGQAALNYPESRGTATAFPLSAFGLSALFFSAIALLFRHGTDTFLFLLASGTVLLPILAFPFLNIVISQTYHTVSQKEDRQLHRRRSSDADDDSPSGKHTTPHREAESTLDQRNSNEHSSLLSSSSSGEDLAASKHTEPDRNHESPHLDIRGFALLPHPEFWQLFCMMGLMTGIGLMTINNIGNDAQALWRHYDENVDPQLVEKRQNMHVSIISFFSFSGRLTSGIGSDYLVSHFNRSRFWCLFASATLFCVAQVLGASIENPTFLILVSGFTGLAYGFLFGVYPSLVAHTFGVHGLSQNWGTMTLAPVISGNIFNLLYGRIYDSHSIVNDDGTRECLEGKACYSSAYIVTFFSAIAAVLLCSWSIWHENQVHKRDLKGRTDHDRLA